MSLFRSISISNFRQSDVYAFCRNDWIMLDKDCLQTAIIKSFHGCPIALKLAFFGYKPCSNPQFFLQFTLQGHPLSSEHGKKNEKCISLKRPLHLIWVYNFFLSLVTQFLMKDFLLFLCERFMKCILFLSLRCVISVVLVAPNRIAKITLVVSKVDLSIHSSFHVYSYLVKYDCSDRTWRQMVVSAY